jgi:hypothetical protein
MRAEVENTMHALPRGRFHPHKCNASANGQGLHLGQRISLIAPPVLEVYERPIITGSGHQLGGLGRSQPKEATQYSLAARKPFSK